MYYLKKYILSQLETTRRSLSPVDHPCTDEIASKSPWKSHVSKTRPAEVVTFGNGRARMVEIGQTRWNGVDDLTSERREADEREREGGRGTGRKERRIVYSNEGVNKWWAARRIDLGRATLLFDTALPWGVATPAASHPPTARRCRPALFPPLLPSLSLSLSLSIYLSFSASRFLSFCPHFRFNNLFLSRGTISAHESSYLPHCYWIIVESETLRTN